MTSPGHVTGVTWRLWPIGFYKLVSFDLFAEGGNDVALRTLLESTFQILGTSKNYCKSV